MIPSVLPAPVSPAPSGADAVDDAGDFAAALTQAEAELHDEGTVDDTDAATDDAGDDAATDATVPSDAVVLVAAGVVAIVPDATDAASTGATAGTVLSDADGATATSTLVESTEHQPGEIGAAPAMADDGVDPTVPADLATERVEAPDAGVVAADGDPANGDAAADGATDPMLEVPATGDTRSASAIDGEALVDAEAPTDDAPTPDAAADGRAASDADGPASATIGSTNDAERGFDGAPARPAGRAAESTGSVQQTPEPDAPAEDGAALATVAPDAAVTERAAPAATPTNVDAAMAVDTATPTATTDAVAPSSGPAPAAAPPVLDQLVEQVGPLLEGPDGTHELSIELRPAELGRVVLDVTLEDGVIHVRVRADEAVSRALLADAMPDLRDVLERAGVRTGTLDVDTGADGRAPGEDTGSGTGRADDDAAEAVASAPTTNATVDADRIDIRI